MDTRQRPVPRLHGGTSEQRGGRIPIHSLLAPTFETVAIPTEQSPPYSPQASSSRPSPAIPSAFTPLNAKFDQAPVRRTSVPTSIPPTPVSPATPNHDDVRANHSLMPFLAVADMQGRTPRAPRPSYSEEQKFFIMYARVMKDQTWPEIEDQFNFIFGTRTKGGLTSVYYRVRKDWGLMEVLKSGPDSFAADCEEVQRRARNFSAEFLGQIGYPLD